MDVAICFKIDSWIANRCILNTAYHFKRKPFECFRCCYGRFCSENGREINNCSNRFNVGDCWLTIQIIDYRACTSSLWYLWRFPVKHSGNNVSSLEYRASVSDSPIVVVAAFNLLKSMSFILTIFGSAVLFCFVARMTKLFFLKVSDKYLVHVTRCE